MLFDFDTVYPKYVIYAEHINGLVSGLVAAETAAASGLMFIGAESLIIDKSNPLDLLQNTSRLLYGSLYKPLSGNAPSGGQWEEFQLTVEDGDGRVIPGIWNNCKWSICVEAYFVPEGLASIPVMGGGVSTDVSVYDTVPLVNYIQDYDSSYTAAAVYVKRPATLPTAGGILLSWTAFSNSAAMADVSLIGAAPSGGTSVGPTGSVTSAISSQLFSNPSFTNASSGWTVAPKVLTSTGLSYGTITLVKNTPNYGLPAPYTTDWTSYRWDTVITPPATASRSVTVQSGWVTAGNGLAQTLDLVDIAGNPVTIDNTSTTLVLSYNYAIGAEGLHKLKKAGKDKFYGYTHILWFSRTNQFLGAQHYRLPTSNYLDGTSSLVTTLKKTKATYEIVPPMGAGYACVCVMLMSDDPPPGTTGYFLSFTNFSAVLYRKVPTT